jgi:hypothetical protein
MSLLNKQESDFIGTIMLEFLWCISHICPSSCTINLNGSGCFYLHLQSPRLLPFIFSTLAIMRKTAASTNHLAFHNVPLPLPNPEPLATNFPPIGSKNLSIKLFCFLMMRVGTRQCHLYAALDSSNKKPHRRPLWWVSMEICLIAPTWFCVLHINSATTQLRSWRAIISQPKR